jgi:hypothetical protein
MKGRIHLYHVTDVQELQPPDMQKRVVCFQWFKTFFVQNPEIWDRRQFSDEAWFHETECIDLQNMCMWATANPAIHEFLHPQKVGMWVALAPGSIIFFHTVTSTNVCLSIYQEFVIN